MPTLRLVRPTGPSAPAGGDAASAAAPAGGSATGLTAMSGSESDASSDEDDDGDEYVAEAAPGTGEAARQKRARSGFRQAQPAAARKVTLRLGKRPVDDAGVEGGDFSDNTEASLLASMTRVLNVTLN